MKELRHRMNKSSLVIVLTMITLVLLSAVSCERRPPLHLHRGADIGFRPIVDIQLDVYWDYAIAYDSIYNWQSEWYYGWDAVDQQIFGDISYVEPTMFNIRRYYTRNNPDAPHSVVYRTDGWRGKIYRADYDFGFWDILVWNDIKELSPVLSLIVDEETSLDRVTAYTHESSSQARYNSKYTHAFYQPELLFSSYLEDEEIRSDYAGFEQMFDEETEEMYWYKKMDVALYPCTYIYLTQIILHHNKGRITSVDGSANLSGMARTVTLNTGIAGTDAVSVNYDVRLKHNCDMPGESVDIVGGRLQTFGICNINPNNIPTRSADSYAKIVESDPSHHYIDLEMQFNNGMDSTFVFDVTDQVRRKFRGGVITVELDVDTIKMPRRSGGSAFDAVVLDYEDGGTHEFEM